MAWRDELQRVEINGRRYVGGSFRGAPFLVEDVELTGGRKIATDEFPYSDEWFDDDLGQKRPEYPITAYVIGDAYLASKGRLIEALNAFGPGELVHPFYGRLTVRCDTFTCSERSGEGRRASFQIQFVPAAGSDGLEVSQIQNVPVASARANTAVASAYQKVAKANAVQGDFLTPIEGAVKSFGAKVRGPFAALAKDAKKGAQFRARLEALVNNASRVVTDPIMLSIQTARILESTLFTPPRIPSDLRTLIGLATKLFDELMGENDPQAPIETPTRAKQAILLRATSEFFATSVALTVADICSGVIFESYDDAIETRDELGGALDGRSNEEGFEDAQAAVEQVRATAFATIPANEEGSYLRQFFTPNVNTPALALAYRFYGDASKELQFVARNRSIQNPCVVRGARQIEVLREL